jgi:Mrp family chromosome partitioning ATPase
MSETNTKIEQNPSSCDSNCAACGTAGCASRQGGEGEQDWSFKTQADSHIKHVIGVVSGKGGVGKSMVCALLANSLVAKGYQVGLLDADITGPSQPRAFGVSERLSAAEGGIVPQKTASGMKIVSTNLVLPDEDTPVIWRGGIITQMVHQFFSEVIWGELDYLVVDMPPGTGDVPLTVFQSFPIDGIVVVTAPQDLVQMIVAKAINMAKGMDIPVLGLVENMARYVCPDCGASHAIFGESKLAALAKHFQIDVSCQLPIMPELAAKMDRGQIAEADLPEIDLFCQQVLDKIKSDTLK